MAREYLRQKDLKISSGPCSFVAGVCSVNCRKTTPLFSGEGRERKMETFMKFRDFSSHLHRLFCRCFSLILKLEFSAGRTHTLHKKSDLFSFNRLQHNKRMFKSYKKHKIFQLFEFKVASRVHASSWQRKNKKKIMKMFRLCFLITK